MAAAVAAGAASLDSLLAMSEIKKLVSKHFLLQHFAFFSFWRAVSLFLSVFCALRSLQLLLITTTTKIRKEAEKKLNQICFYKRSVCGVMLWLEVRLQSKY